MPRALSSDLSLSRTSTPPLALQLPLGLSGGRSLMHTKTWRWKLGISRRQRTTPTLAYPAAVDRCFSATLRASFNRRVSDTVPETDDRPIVVGSVLGKYRVTGELSRGGVGTGAVPHHEL